MTFLLTVMCKVPRIQKNEVVASQHGNCAIIQWSNPTKEARWKITPCFSPDISIYRCQCAPTLMSPSIETFFLVSHSKKANIVQVLYPKSEAEEQTTHFSNALPTLNPIVGGGFLRVCINQCHPNTPDSLFTEDALALAVWIVMNGVDTGRKKTRGTMINNWVLRAERNFQTLSHPGYVTERLFNTRFHQPWVTRAHYIVKTQCSQLSLSSIEYMLLSKYIHY